MAFNKCSCIGGIGTWQAWKGQQVVREAFGQPRTQEELSDHDIASMNALLQKELHETHIFPAEVVDPRVGVDEGQRRFHAERLAR